MQAYLLLLFSPRYVVTVLTFAPSQDAHPEKTAVPGGSQLEEWLSFSVLVSVAYPLNPLLMQRVFAAKSAAQLRLTYSLMAFAAFAATFPALVVGWTAIPLACGPETCLPDVDELWDRPTTCLANGHVCPDQLPCPAGGGLCADGGSCPADHSDEMFTIVCRRLMATGPGKVVVSVLLASAVAALMSTADSAMMAFSSIFTIDLVAPALERRSGQPADEASLLKVGKICSVGVVVLNLLLTEYPINLDTLLKLQNELAMQCTPAVYLGLHSRSIATQPIAVGLTFGIVLSVGGHLLAVDTGGWIIGVLVKETPQTPARFARCVPIAAIT